MLKFRKNDRFIIYERRSLFFFRSENINDNAVMIDFGSGIDLKNQRKIACKFLRYSQKANECSLFMFR